MNPVRFLKKLAELNQKKYGMPEIGVGYKMALIDVIKLVSGDLDQRKEEGEKLNDLSLFMLQEQPTQETCKKMIEFISEYMTRKSQMHELTDPMRRAFE